MNASRRAVNISILNTKRVAAGLAFAAVLLAGRLHLSQQNFPDLVIVNARVHTVNPARPSAEAIAISAGKITAVGSSREIRALAGPNTQINEWVRNGGIKLAVDGGFEGGWMTEPYEPPFDEGGKFTGINTLKLADFIALVKEANRGGWRIATPAVGDAAIDEVLTAYEAADTEKSIHGRR
jgi:predicted amidohydrolase YtcJ